MHKSNFNNEQLEFINYILYKYNNNDRKGIILNNSPAGTGKTTVAKHLNHKLNYNNQENILFLAPTHKACLILKKDIFKGVKTIHNFLNAKADYDEEGNLYFTYSTKKIYDKIIVIDECSMVNTEMFNIINKLSKNNLIIYMGDELQLPPIDNNILDPEDIKKEKRIKESTKSPTFNIKPKFEFKKNMRSERLVATLMLQNAREAIYNNKMPNRLLKKTINDAIEDFVNKKDVIVLAYTNIAVNNYNKKIRSVLFNTSKDNLQEYYINEQLVFSGFREVLYEDGRTKKKYHSSDKITIINLSIQTINISLKKFECDCLDENYKKVLCKEHNFRKGFITLDFYKIIDEYGNIWYQPVNKKKYIDQIQNQYKQYGQLKKGFRWKEYYDFIGLYNADLKYIYSMTIHKSQGSQWKKVYVDRNNLVNCSSKDQILKLHGYYTAISRMQEDVYDI